jgi:L-ascorbate metabolism protein UlaG (beta-lactamase superfamily)
VLPDGTYGGNPGGFVIENQEGCIYFAGDTALTKDMELIREGFELDWAILPIGDNFTMGVDDAIKACNLIGCDRVLGMHYDTFPYIEIDKDAAEMSFKKAKKELVLLEIGAERQLN